VASDELAEKLNTLPTRPGVYLMKDARGVIIYIGKAVNLRARVRSYLHPSSESPKTCRLVEKIADVEFIVTGSELEALILECNLIKKHRPRYNVRLKDDKRYPYIKVSWQDPFPRVYTVRQMHQDGARYYGPYTASWAVYETLELARRIFPYLTCNRQITGRDKTPCLYYHIRLCAGPCIGAANQTEYRAIIAGLCDFLEGKTDVVVTELRQQMEAAAEKLEFERAARVRDQIQAVEKIVERQKVVSAELADQDVVALARADGEACMQVFFIRQGKLIGREYFVLEGTADEEVREIIASFIKQFYEEAAYIPPEILLPEGIDEARIIEQWLGDKRGTRVAIRVPRRGQKRGLVQMATENAVETLKALRAQWLADEGRQADALAELQALLNLSEPPARIECYDISNIGGTSAVGSMVVFVKGVPRKSDYRRFRIKTVPGADDYAMMREVLRRRFARFAKEQDSQCLADTGSLAGAEVDLGPGRKGQDAWAILPNLIIVDGGKGQLNAALEVLDEYELRDALGIIGLAKEMEEIFMPGHSDPIVLPGGSQGLFLLQRIRDEAHRFAVTYHRQVRGKRSLTSALDEIPGVGPKRRRALLRAFGSLEAIRQADVEALATVPGMTRAVAEKVKASL
jgi:excinuclease ABC subunit C